jgi:hypothetical protein
MSSEYDAMIASERIAVSAPASSAHGSVTARRASPSQCLSTSASPPAAPTSSSEHGATPSAPFPRHGGAIAAALAPGCTLIRCPSRFRAPTVPAHTGHGNRASGCAAASCRAIARASKVTPRF